MLEITLEDVGHILELPYRGRVVELDVGNSRTPFWERHIKGTSLTSDSIELALEALLEKKPKTELDKDGEIWAVEHSTLAQKGFGDHKLVYQ